MVTHCGSIRNGHGVVFRAGVCYIGVGAQRVTRRVKKLLGVMLAMALLMKTVKRMTAFLSVVIALLALNGPTTFTPLDADNLRLNAAFLADTHIDNVFNDGTHAPLLARGLRDISNAAASTDVLVIAGDLTEGGILTEYLTLDFTLESFCNAGALFLPSGNHDIWGVRGLFTGNTLMPYAYNAEKYLGFLESATGNRPEQIYFYQIINDCWFIALNSEALVKETLISPEQIQWLDEVLAQAAAGGNPIFVVCHHPLASIENAGDLYAVLKKYDGIADVFFVTGHWHTGFHPGSILEDGTVRFVALPSYGKGSGSGYTAKGSGFQAEMYDNTLVFRARNYAQGEWVPEYDKTITLLP